MQGDIVYVVIDKEAQKYEDIVLGVYASIADAASLRMMYASVTVGETDDDSRFTVIEEKVL